MMSYKRGLHNSEMKSKKKKKKESQSLFGDRYKSTQFDTMCFLFIYWSTVMTKTQLGEKNLNELSLFILRHF